MNLKLTQADRRTIHDMLFHGHTHAEIAEAFHVCTRTIDREAAWWLDHTVTVRTVRIDGGFPKVTVRVGKALHDVDAEEVKAEAIREALAAGSSPMFSEDVEQAMKEIEALDPFEILEGIDMAELMEQAELAAKELEACPMPEIAEASLDMDMPELDAEIEAMLSTLSLCHDDGMQGQDAVMMTLPEWDLTS